VDEGIRARLRCLAPILNQLTMFQDAECFYDVLSGGLLWRDEIPDASVLAPGTFEGLRGGIRYRTTLILGEADQQYQDLWAEAKNLFPNWPGFSPARRSIELRSVCLELQSKAVGEMDELFDN